MGAMDIARRNRAISDCFTIAGQRAGVFQPLQFLSPQDALVALRRLLAFPFSGRQFFTLGLGHAPQLGFAHRLVHSPRCAPERFLGTLSALGRERRASRHLLSL